MRYTGLARFNTTSQLGATFVFSRMMHAWVVPHGFKLTNPTLPHAYIALVEHATVGVCFRLVDGFVRDIGSIHHMQRSRQQASCLGFTRSCFPKLPNWSDASLMYT